jgi:LCP family protein required for cell wall assembly
MKHFLYKLMELINKTPIISGIKVGLVLSFFMSVIFFINWWNTPLGTELVKITGTPEKSMLQSVPEETLIPDIKISPETGITEVPTETTNLFSSATPPPETICGGPETMYGVESDNYVYGLSDAIRVVRVDFVNGRITVLPLPRDMYVSIPVAVPGITGSVTNGKLNQAYFYGSPGMGYYEGEDHAPGLLAITIGQNFNLRIDQYISVNTRIFRRMVDQIGGVNVYIPDDVYGHYFREPVLYLKAGSHHLDGKQAEMVARHRTLIGDFGRVRNQTILFKAFIKALLTPEGIKNVPGLIEIYQTSVLMDFTPNEISKLLCLITKIDLKNDIVFTEFPQQMLEEARVYDKVQESDMYVLLPDHELVVGLLADFQLGRWP